MDSLIIEATKATPDINFGVDGKWTLQGKCCPENPISFFEPIFEWISQYKTEKNPHIELDMILTYFNTSSSKVFLDFFDLMVEVKESGKEVTVNWFYEQEDEDMMESGEEFSEDVDLNFNLVAISSEE